MKSFTIGTVAGAVALSVSYVQRAFVGGPFLPELASQTLFSLTPGQVESGAVGALGELAKFTAYALAILMSLAMYGLLAGVVFEARTNRSWKQRWKVGVSSAAIAYVTFIAFGAVLLYLTEVYAQPTSPASLTLYMLAPNIVYGALLAWAARPIVPTQPREEGLLIEPKGFGRRRFLIKAGASAAVAAVVLYFGVGLLFKGEGSSPTDLATFYANEVTHTDQFFRVDVDILAPSIDSSTWKLAVRGLVKSPMSLSYDQLRALPQVEEFATLECVSNGVGGDLISTALWRGARLRDILQLVSPAKNASYVVFRCQDGYDVGIPLDKATSDGTILAYEMNGSGLPVNHGYPLRAIVPGYYGMMNAKWVTEIELVDHEYLGFWQRAGWSNEAEYQTGSAIVNLGDGRIGPSRFNVEAAQKVPLGSEFPIAGMAFAGDRGISKVEVSTDGGSNWTPASLKDPLSGYTWVLWEAGWNPPADGQYRIAVRATDKRGRIQTAQFSGAFPSGATGYHIVDVKVVSSMS